MQKQRIIDILERSILLNRPIDYNKLSQECEKLKEPLFFSFTENIRLARLMEDSQEELAELGIVTSIIIDHRAEEQIFNTTEKYIMIVVPDKLRLVYAFMAATSEFMP